VIADIRKWHAEERDWRKAAKRLAEQYPYERFGGGCPMVTNHGVIILALLYGGGDFDRSMMIVNTCGWDTDCNSGNLGCLLGIRSGLAAFGGADWRGPVADRIIMPTADAGAAITDAAIEAGRIINCGRALAGAEPFAPKGGARFHFEFPGSVQGFRAEGEGAKVENVAGHSASGTRSLAVRFKSAARAVTPTFIQPQDEKFVNYRLFASPTLSPGQTLRATVWADSKNAKSITCRLTLTTCAVEGEYRPLDGDAAQLAPGESAELTWRVPEVPGAVITQAGISAAGASGGTVYLDALGWNGEPDLALSPADAPGKMWQRAWVNAADTLGFHGGSVRCGQNRGTGLAIQGTYEWADYRLTANVKTDLSAAAGLAVRVQGMRRYCALELIPGAVRLVKVYDEDEIVLASEAVDWRFGGTHALSLEARGETLKAAVDGKTLIEADDPDTRLKSGAAALIVTEGRLIADGVRVQPVGE
jgi:hypothetical protein